MKKAYYTKSHYTDNN